ncbi:hypothetical protein F2Q70_00021953 [Brassica cretica]|uniref:Uncharacterized protein n=1 Tax=Brassica cretica TaxID=69181 RepID=A0A8S9GP64_BRACR|nr:hypothetical protein F2Q70_00021953 [Brassica cretica]KAF2557183.1 hypothetical protein F2Q68_00015731 [Brassica cretica]
MGRDARCLERSCVWSQMCAEVVGRNREASSSYRFHELVKLEIDGFQKTKMVPRIVSASEGASEIGITNGLR